MYIAASGVRKIVLFITTAMTLIALAVACDEPAPPELPPPQVTVAEAVGDVVAEYGYFTGNTEAVASIEVRARVEGVLQEMAFEPSRDVKKGQLLFTIDPIEYEAAVAQAQAELATANAELARAKAEKQDADWELARVKAMVAEDVAQQREHQEAITAQQAAMAKVSAAESQILAAEAALKRADINLGYTKLMSPIDGRAGRDLVNVGNLVGASENTLLTTVVAMNPMHVYFNIPERIIVEALRNRPVDQREVPEIPFEVALEGDEGFPHHGVTDYIDNRVDKTTGTIRVRGVVKNDNKLLFPGLFVRVRIRDRRPTEAVLVHERAIGTDLGGKYVLVVNEVKDDDDEIQQMVELRRVTLGPLTDEGFRAVTEGLEEGERYIVDGLLRARPGLPVKPEMLTEKPTTTATSPAL